MAQGLSPVAGRGKHLRTRKIGGLTLPPPQSYVTRMSATAAILPVALVVLIGYLARRSNLVPAGSWQGVELFCYRVLYPAVMMVAVYRSDLEWSKIGPFGMSLLATSAAVSLVVLALKPILNLPNPSFTTIFQTSTRWNTFVSLALAAQMMGQPGVGMVSVAVAFLIPAMNVLNIGILAIWGSGRSGIFSMLKAIATNPLILGCMTGLALNLLRIHVPDPAIRGIDMIGTAAISVSLLIVGAGIQVDRLWRVSASLFLAVGMRLIISPLIFWGLAQYFGLSDQLALAGLIVTSVPTAANGYLVARQMGGDAELYADILTWQTVLAVLSIPFIISSLA